MLRARQPPPPCRSVDLTLSEDATLSMHERTVPSPPPHPPPGFFMPIFWFISTLLPLCLPGRAVRQAACASCIAAIVYLILALALGPTLSRRYY